MTITAKYVATCSACRQAITPGQQIEWTKGQPVRHTSCGGATQTLAPTRTASRRPGKWTGCSCGSREDSSGTLIPARNNCASCNHDA